MLWDLHTRELLSTFNAFDESTRYFWVDELTFSPDSSLLTAVVRQDGPGAVSIWSTQTNELIHSFLGDRSVQFSPSGDYLATFNKMSNTVRIYERSTKKLVEHTISQSKGSTVRFWNEDRLVIGTEEGICVYDWKKESIVGTQLLTHPVSSLDVLKDGRVAIGGEDRSLGIFDLNTLSQITPSKLLLSVTHSLESSETTIT